MERFIDKILNGNCIEIMKGIPSNSVHLIFADPPYNIGIKYDLHEDNMADEDYISWTEKWVDECVRVLKEDGSIYIAINDNYVADFVQILKKKGLYMRNWVIWYYTFGQNQRKKFSKSHTHILYFSKDPERFTFNTDSVRIKSVRQKIGDKRAHPKGKVPDDVWQVSRVAGTFKERVKNFPCQMPVNILERIIRASSNKDEIVLDPFAGSGTTLFVAKKLGRKYVGIEISQKYKKMIDNRLRSIL